MKIFNLLLMTTITCCQFAWSKYSSTLKIVSEKQHKETFIFVLRYLALAGLAFILIQLAFAFVPSENTSIVQFLLLQYVDLTIMCVVILSTLEFLILWYRVLKHRETLRKKKESNE